MDVVHINPSDGVRTMGSVMGQGLGSKNQLLAHGAHEPAQLRVHSKLKQLSVRMSSQGITGLVVAVVVRTCSSHLGELS